MKLLFSLILLAHPLVNSLLGADVETNQFRFGDPTPNATCKVILGIVPNIRIVRGPFTANVFINEFILVKGDKVHLVIQGNQTILSRRKGWFAPSDEVGLDRSSDIKTNMKIQPSGDEMWSLYFELNNPGNIEPKNNLDDRANRDAFRAILTKFIDWSDTAQKNAVKDFRKNIGSFSYGSEPFEQCVADFVVSEDGETQCRLSNKKAGPKPALLSVKEAQQLLFATSDEAIQQLWHFWFEAQEKVKQSNKATEATGALFK